MGAESGAAADPGLANERTALAWQRTSLSLLAGSAVLGKLTVDDLGWTAIALLGAAVLLSTWAFFESTRRYAQARGVRARGRGRGGRAALSLTVATLLLSVTEIAALMTR